MRTLKPSAGPALACPFLSLSGLVFWWLELPAPLVCRDGALVGAAVLGAAIVGMPVAAYFAMQGHWPDALALTAFGAIVIGLIDNLIYPLIVKDRLHLHAVPVLVSIIGGLIVFGASGIVLGPLLLAVTDALEDLATASREGLNKSTDHAVRR